MATYESAGNAETGPREILRKDHASIANLFLEYEESGGESPKNRKRLFGQIMREIEVHAALVDEVVLPALQDAGREDLLSDFRRSLTESSTLLGSLSDLEPEDPQFEASMARLRRSAEDHAAMEEKQILPVLAGRLTDREREDMATRLMAGKARRNEGVREA